MTGSRHAIALMIGISALLLAGASRAQEDLSAGKTPEELFKLDCAICHKSPQGLSKAGGLFGLDSFLAQHYTASGATASAIAAYLKSVDSPAASAPHRRSRTPHRNATAPHKPDKTKSDAKSATKSDEPKKKDAAKTDVKTDATAKKDDAAAKPVSDKPKSGEPGMADKKTPAPHSEATGEKPKAADKPADKKTD